MNAIGSSLIATFAEYSELLVPPTSVIFYFPYSILVSKRFSRTFCELVSRKIVLNVHYTPYTLRKNFVALIVIS